MVSYRGFSAQVLCDGSPLHEYQIEYDQQSKTATCFVESDPGKEYSVTTSWQELDSGHKQHDVAAFVVIDGMKIQPDWSLTFGGTSSRIWKGAGVGPTTLRPFRFSALCTTDDRDLCENNMKRLENIGTIKVLLHHCTLTNATNATNALPMNYDDICPRKPVDEKKTKVMKVPEHCTEFGHRTNVRPPRIVDCIYHDPPENPYVTFLLKYRSRDFLEIKGIIPRHDNAQTPTTNRERGTSEARGVKNENEALRRQVRKLEAEKRRYKERERRLHGDVQVDLTGDTPVEETLPAPQEDWDIVDITEEN